jgi:hypothetical protein
VPIGLRSDRWCEREADEDAERAQQREVFVLDEVCGSGRQQR